MVRLHVGIEEIDTKSTKGNIEVQCSLLDTRRDEKNSSGKRENDGRGLCSFAQSRRKTMAGCRDYKFGDSSRPREDRGAGHAGNEKPPKVSGLTQRIVNARLNTTG